MGYNFNPFTGNFDEVGGGTPGGSTKQIQFNDAGAFGGDVDLTWDKTTNVLGIAGNINLDDGGTYTTTVQCVTPTANRTISFPDATGTVALVAGSSGQLLYNNAGANAGLSTSVVGATGNVSLTLNGAASTPPLAFTGTWFTGGTSTTTKPQVLIEPTGTTSTAWSTSGTGLGVNAASGFTGNLLDLQLNGSSQFSVNRVGAVTGVTIYATGAATGFIGNRLFLDYANQDVVLNRDAANTLAQRNGTNAQTYRVYNTYTSSTNYELGKLEWSSNVFRIGTEKGSGGGTARNLELQTDGITRATITSAGLVGIGTTSPSEKLEVNGGIRTTGALASAAPSSLAFDYLSNGRVIVYGPDNGTQGTLIFLRSNSTAGSVSESARIDSSGRLLVGTTTNTGGSLLQVNDNRIRIATAKTPASATDTGSAGEICWDADYIYVCTATNTWKRAALSTW